MKFLLVVSVLLSVTCALRPEHDHREDGQRGCASCGHSEKTAEVAGAGACCGCPKKKTLGVTRNKCKEGVEPIRRDDCGTDCTSTSDTKCWKQSIQKVHCIDPDA
eukprot:Skav215862  [mRNA]  locus=scaffold1079:46769:52820:+ [translate_table: standard]